VRVDDLRQTSVLVVDVVDGVALAVRRVELVRFPGDAAKFVEVDDAALLIDQRPAILAVEETEEASLWRGITAVAEAEPPDLAAAVAVLDVAVGHEAQPLEEGRIPAEAERRRAEGAGAVGAVDGNVPAGTTAGVEVDRRALDFAAMDI